MWQTILTSAITCFLALIITCIFNWALNQPKKQAKKYEELDTQRECDKKELISAVKSVEEKITTKLQDQTVREKVIIANIGVIKLGLQASLKNDLKLRYDEWLRKGYAPIDAKDDLERMYQVYHQLGANGVMDSHRERFLNLPDHKLGTKGE